MKAPECFCIILAGGAGRRLWPGSRKQQPKQFIDFLGCGRTLIQQTFDRFARFVPADHILVSTYKDYVPLVKEQLPALPVGNILSEGSQQSTALAAAWATWHVARLAPGANLIVTPADQIIHDEARFEEEVKKGLQYVDGHSEFLVMGIKPTFPDTGYGYIQMGGRVAGGMYRVKSFSEKPETDYAEAFVESGEFLWNTGLFLWNERTMWQTLHERFHAIEVPDRSQGRGAQFTEEEEAVFINENFPAELPRSIDLCVLERCTNVVVQTCTFGWCDIGNWTDLYQAGRKDADSNVVTGEGQTMLSGCRKTIVRLPAGKTAVINGLENYVVVQDGDVLLICPNDPALMRRLVTEARVQLGE